MKARMYRRQYIALGVLSAMALSVSIAPVMAVPKPTPKPTLKLPAVITVGQITTVTGAIAATGKQAVLGAQIAMEEINASNFLGKGTKIQINLKDSTYNATVAAQMATELAADSSVTSILGPQVSSEALAVSPIATANKIPVVFTQSGADGILISPYTFRATPPLSTFYSLVTRDIAKKGGKTVSVVYPVNNPTYAGVSTGTLEELAPKSGLSILSSNGVTITTTDFQSVMTKIARENPSAALLNLTAPQMATAVTQLRQAGYTGQIYALSGVAGGAMKSAGKSAEGVIWSNTFAPGLTSPAAVKFTKYFKERFNLDPTNIAAEEYDAMWFIARGIKTAGSATREGITAGLTKITRTPGAMKGVLGDYTWVGNDARTSGYLVTWDGTQDKVIK